MITWACKQMTNDRLKYVYESQLKTSSMVVSVLPSKGKAKGVERLGFEIAHDRGSGS